MNNWYVMFYIQNSIILIWLVTKALHKSIFDTHNKTKICKLKKKIKNKEPFPLCYKVLKKEISHQPSNYNLFYISHTICHQYEFD